MYSSDWRGESALTVMTNRIDLENLDRVSGNLTYYVAQFANRFEPV